MDNLIVENNSGYAGGVFVNEDSFLAMSNSIIRNNSSTDGGGVFIQDSEANLTNLIISDNTASNDGGGIGIVNSDVDIDNSIISNNSAQEGGGINNEDSESSISVRGIIVDDSIKITNRVLANTYIIIIVIKFK